jgi:uncharacterized Zn finger protein
MRRLAQYSALDEHTRQQLLGESWWTTSFLNMMRPGKDTTQLVKGRRLAERGQVILSEPYAGGVDAIVLGAVGGSQNVSIWLNDLEEDWEIVIRILAAETELYSKLLKGDYPEELDDMFRQAGLIIIPESLEDLDYKCDCDSVHTCSHIVATYMALGNRVNEDPFILFLLRGKTRDEITHAVTLYLEEQNPQEEPSSVISEDSSEADQSPDWSSYYDPGQDLSKVSIRIHPPDGTETDLISLLGTSPFKIGNTNLSKIISASYPKAALYAWKLTQAITPDTKPVSSSIHPGDTLEKGE